MKTAASMKDTMTVQNDVPRMRVEAEINVLWFQLAISPVVTVVITPKMCVLLQQIGCPAQQGRGGDHEIFIAQTTYQHDPGGADDGAHGALPKASKKKIPSWRRSR